MDDNEGWPWWNCSASLDLEVSAAHGPKVVFLNVAAYQIWSRRKRWRLSHRRGAEGPRRCCTPHLAG
ncbi:hypothetical protein E2562_008006 [Oryza meyeriana var. granulata]|uniref:Uncharacterized protein n=1 Tax=Oryza meyeriana var. granulata TaxID=110450 RepID=A0A6G1DEJ5_9ORYZ|nr:hypothetical protein E2562_008006 [Oryza meyeriana var. granulata]